MVAGKRIIMAIMLVLVTVAGPGSGQAAGWQWVASNDECNWEIDTSSVKTVEYRFAGTNTVCWIRATALDNSCTISRFAFRMKNDRKEALMMSSISYDKDGNVVASKTVTTEPFDFQYGPVAARSIAEALFDAAMEYGQ